MTAAHDYELTIVEKPTPFTELDFSEPIDANRLRRIIHSQELRDRWLKPTKPMGRYYQNDITGGVTRDANTCYEVEKKALMKMMKKVKRGVMTVRYAFGKLLKFGRVYAIDSMSVGCLNKDVRHTLCGDRWVDIDIVCCHPNLMVQLCEKHAVPIRCETLREYINGREEILAEQSRHYGVSRDDAKQLFNILTFGGSLKTWVCEYLSRPDDVDKYTMTSFVSKYYNEMSGIAKVFYDNNPKIAKELGKERYKAMYSITHYLLGDYERVILETAYEFAASKIGARFSNKFVGCYDGFMVMKDVWDDAWIPELEKIVLERTGFVVKYISKPMDGGWPALMEEPKGDFCDLAHYNALYDKYCNERGAINYLNNNRAGHFIYDGSQWFCWPNKPNTTWETNTTALTYAIMDDMSLYIDGIIEELSGHMACQQDDSEIYKSVCELKSNFKKFRQQSLTSAAFVRHVIELGEKYFLNTQIEFDMNQNLIGMPYNVDGSGFYVYDIINREYREAVFGDYISMKIRVPYQSIMNASSNDDETKSAIMDLLMKIQPEQAERQLLLKIMASGLSGRPVEKFIIYNGGGRNGKGLLDEFMVRALGDYATYASVSIITEKTQQSAAANPELAKLDKKRYVVMKEPEKAIPINNSSMRDLTGGGELQARTLYSTKTSVHLHNTQILEANAKPNLKHDPEKADEERLIDLNFPSTFTSADEVDEANHIYEAKTEYKTIEWQDKHMGGLITILLCQLHLFKNAGYKLDTFIPESVKARTTAYMMKSFEVFNSFKLIYRQIDEDYVEASEPISVAKVATTIRNHDTFKLLPKTKQREFSAQYIKDFILGNKFFKKYIKHDTHTKQTCLFGWEIIPADDEE
jgi:hypothetical protein